MNRLILSLVVITLSISTALSPNTFASDGQADAKTLLSSAQNAVGVVVKAAQADPGLKAGEAKAKPFWDAMKETNEALSKAETGLSLKDHTFFSGLAMAYAGVTQADVALIMNGGGNAAVKSGMTTLLELVTRLDETYSKEAAREKQGGKLTSAERKQFDKLVAQQKVVMKKLDQVERNAAKNNTEMKKGIEKIRKEAKKIRRSNRNASALRAARLASSWMWAWHWWWGPWGVWCPGWIDINIIIWDDWTDAVLYDWDLVDTYVDVADLDLADLELSDMELAATDDFLVNGDFSLDDNDLQDMTSDMELGWDAVDSDFGMDAMDRMGDNMESTPFEPGFDAHTFDDFGGMDDFGGGFDGGDW